MAIAFVEDGVKETRIDVHFLYRGGKRVEELTLRAQSHHPVSACAEHQRWRVYRACVRDDAGRRVVKIEQHVDRYLSKNQRIALVVRRLCGVVRQQTSLDVAFD